MRHGGERRRKMPVEQKCVTVKFKVGSYGKKAYDGFLNI